VKRVGFQIGAIEAGGEWWLGARFCLQLPDVSTWSFDAHTVKWAAPETSNQNVGIFVLRCFSRVGSIIFVSISCS
jgi:hypothetical protein